MVPGLSDQQTILEYIDRTESRGIYYRKITGQLEVNEQGNFAGFFHIPEQGGNETPLTDIELGDDGTFRFKLAGTLEYKGKLTDDEMETMRTHPSHGHDLLSETNQLSEECKVIVMQHHERNDGSGYPLGLSGDDIHLYARICSIADVYDALTSERTYKAKLEPFYALKLMKEEMITHFSKELFDKFVLLFK